jgi:hypothetical protein
LPANRLLEIFREIAASPSAVIPPDCRDRRDEMTTPPVVVIPLHGGSRHVVYRTMQCSKTEEPDTDMIGPAVRAVRMVTSSVTKRSDIGQHASASASASATAAVTGATTNLRLDLHVELLCRGFLENHRAEVHAAAGGCRPACCISGSASRKHGVAAHGPRVPCAAIRLRSR